MHFGALDMCIEYTRGELWSGSVSGDTNSTVNQRLIFYSFNHPINALKMEHMKGAIYSLPSPTFVILFIDVSRCSSVSVVINLLVQLTLMQGSVPGSLNFSLFLIEPRPDVNLRRLCLSDEVTAGTSYF